MALKKQIKETKAAEVKAAAETKEEVKTAVKAAEDKVSEKVDTKDMIASVKKDWTKQKHKISEIKSIELYVKPEDYAVYYVINGEHTGKVWL